ncbi:MAG: HlyD protein [Ignavibacteria bacterium]|nr:HlyD protein [Ignavibacteria bacterium]
MALKKSNKIIFLILALTLIAIIIILRITSNKSQEAIKDKKQFIKTAIAVNSIIIKPKTISDKIIATGTIAGNEEVELRCETSGRITKILFNEGAKVHQGDILVKTNDAELQAQLKKAQSKLKLSGEIELRQKSLFEKQGISRQTYDEALSEKIQLEADVEFIRAQIDKTEIHAPFDGIIGIRSVSIGTYLTPQIQIATIQSVNPVKIDFTVPQTYSELINMGKNISIKLSGKSRIYNAKIYAIEPKINLDSRSLAVRAIMPNNNGEMTPGAFVAIEIGMEEIQNSLMAPTESLITDINGESVFIYKNGKAISKKIISGIRTEKEVQIVSGLNPGDTLITSGIIQLKSGVAVKLNSIVQ